MELLVGLLRNPSVTSLIQERLPPAFQMVEDELGGNPAVGLLRQQVILGMLIAFLGQSNVKVPESGVEADMDCHVADQPLSIKTISGAGRVRLKWTANAVKAKEFIQTYRPSSCLLVIRVAWQRAGYVCYIPLPPQQNAFQSLGERYLDYRGRTNTRGVNLSAEAENLLNRHSQTITLPILWRRSGAVIDPVDKWVNYWKA